MRYAFGTSRLVAVSQSSNHRPHPESSGIDRSLKRPILGKSSDLDDV